MSDRDAKLFEVFVRENAGSLMAYLRTLTSDSALAEDLFQETLLTAWRRFDEFDTSKPLTPWLRGIALNLVRNAWRKQTSCKLVFDANSAEMVASTVAGIERQPGETWHEKLSVLADCISELPPKSRRLIDANYGDEVSTKELSRQLGLNQATVRKRLQRLREVLGQCMRRKLGQNLG